MQYFLLYYNCNCLFVRVRKILSFPITTKTAWKWVLILAQPSNGRANQSDELSVIACSNYKIVIFKLFMKVFPRIGCKLQYFRVRSVSTKSLKIQPAIGFASFCSSFYTSDDSMLADLKNCLRFSFRLMLNFHMGVKIAASCSFFGFNFRP